MAEQHTLTVKVTGDSSQLVAALNRAQAELAQLDRQSNQTNAGFGTLGTSAGSASGALGSMSNVMAGIGWGVAISGAIAVGTELYNIGRASQVATNTFNQLQGGAEQASASLAMLQEATSFTVPDTTLMSISNLYTQMGLATDPTEVARLAEMGATLGQAMGSSAEEAMRTFSFLLSNQSIELLDTFGISSGKVRERIEELRKANGDLARDQAFVTAVLEEGALAMERLGDATEQNISAVGQLTTRFQNLMAEMGKPVASAVENVAGGIEGFLSKKDFTADIARQVESLYGQGQLNLNFGVLGISTSDVVYYAEQVANRVYESGSATKALVDIQTLLNTEYQNGNRDLENQVVILEALVDLKRQELVQQQSVNQLQSLAIAERQEQQRQTDALIMLSLTSTDAYASAINRLKDLSSGLVPVDEIENAESLARNLTHQIDELLSRDENNPTLKTLETMKGQLEGIAESARRAYDEMGLATALGLGLPPEQRLTADILKMAGIEGRQAEYLTGQRTQLSEMFESSVLPLLQGIETQFGEDEAARVGDFIAQLMKEGIARGFESNPVQLMEFILGNVDYRYDEGQARSVVVQAGDTLTAIAQREGVSVQFLAEINKLEDPNMILTGSELVVEVGARITRVLPFTPEDEEYLTQSTLDMIYGGQPMTDENDKPITPLSPIRDDALETLATSQEIVTTLEELQPPELTPARMGLVSGDVADVGSLEVVNMIDAKLKEISGKIYKVNMTVELDARIRTGAGFKIIPITMAEIQSDLRAASNILRTPLGQ